MRDATLILLGLGLAGHFAARRIETAHALAGTTAVVLAVTAPLAWIIERVVVAWPLLDPVRPMLLALVAATVAQGMAMAVQRRADAAQRTLGPWLALLATGCALAGTMVLLPPHTTLLDTALRGFALALAFAAVLAATAAMRQRIEAADVPASLRGAPIALLNAGLLALACLGLTGSGAG